MGPQPVHTIVLSGYYGFRNSGDEAVLQSILLALDEQGKAAGVRIEPVVLSADPGWTERTYGVRAVPRMNPAAIWSALKESSGLISGGGSLLQDVTSAKTIPYYLAVMVMAQWLKKPVFVYSQGVGPVKRRWFHPFIRRVLDKAAYLSVRDEESAALLRSMGIGRTLDVVPDPVMGLDLPPSSGDGDVEAEGKRPVIGVSVRYWTKDRSELRGLAESLERILQETDAEVRFLPFHLPVDEEASREMADWIRGDRDRIRIVTGMEHPQDMLKEIAHCDLVIGMRLHSLIYAANRLVPMIGISYDPKVDQFLNRLGQKPVTGTEPFQSEAVAEESLRLLRSGCEWKVKHKPMIEKLKQEAHKPAQQIAAILRQKERDGRWKSPK